MQTTAHNHPSGRSATRIPQHLRAILSPTPGTLPPRCLAQDAWLHAKELQTLATGTSARITPDRLMILEQQRSLWPDVAAPMIELDGLTEVEAARQLALPATRRAVQALRADRASRGPFGFLRFNRNGDSA